MILPLSNWQLKQLRTHEANKLTCFQVSDIRAQLVKHCTSIAEVMGSNPVEAACFFRVSLIDNCLNCPECECEDHFSLSSITRNSNIYLFRYPPLKCCYDHFVFSSDFESVFV